MLGTAELQLPTEILIKNLKKPSLISQEAPIKRVLGDQAKTPFVIRHESRLLFLFGRCFC